MALLLPPKGQLRAFAETDPMMQRIAEAQRKGRLISNAALAIMTSGAIRGMGARGGRGGRITRTPRVKGRLLLPETIPSNLPVKVGPGRLVPQAPIIAPEEVMQGHLIKEPTISGIKIKIIDEDLPKGLDGFYNEETGAIHISNKLSFQKRAEIIRHESEHARQAIEGVLPTSKFVEPESSIKKFMDYFTDPQEVKARATEKGESIPEIWDEVFRLRAGGAGKPLKVDKITPNVSEKILPETPLSAHDRIAWHIRRTTGKLLPTDPKPIKLKQETIRIHFKDQANGIIAEEILQDAGIEAFSSAPYSVDVTINDLNAQKLLDILGVDVKKVLPLSKPQGKLVNP